MARTGTKLTEKPALVVGVAGIMGSGKTTVARVFEELGGALIEGDTVSKSLLRDKGIRQAIVEAFGEGITTRDGDIDSVKLGAAAFADSKSARRLDELTRDALITRIRARIEEMKESARVVVVDAALLPEWDSRSWIDVLVVVDSDEKAAVERSCCDPRFNASNVRARMKHQFSRKEKTRDADVIIPNYGTLEELKDRARKVFWTLVQISGKG